MNIFKVNLSGEGSLQLAIDVHGTTFDHSPAGEIPFPVDLAIATAAIVVAIGRHAVAGLPAGLSLQLALLMGRAFRSPDWDVVRPGLAVAVNAAAAVIAGRVDMLRIILGIVAARAGSGAGAIAALVAAMLAGVVGIPLSLGITGIPGLVLGVAAARTTLVNGHAGILWQGRVSDEVKVMQMPTYPSRPAAGQSSSHLRHPRP